MKMRFTYICLSIINDIFDSPLFQLHQGDVHISGCYQPVAGKIVFNVVEARNLPRVSLLGAVSK